MERASAGCEVLRMSGRNFSHQPNSGPLPGKELFVERTMVIIVNLAATQFRKPVSY
jgi:hypothetical protein